MIPGDQTSAYFTIIPFPLISYYFPYISFLSCDLDMTSATRSRAGSSALAGRAGMGLMQQRKLYSKEAVQNLEIKIK